MILDFMLISSLFVYTVSGIDPTEKCNKKWKKIGCYHDRVIPNRPLTVELVNHRDETSKVYDGHILNWYKWPQSLHALACACEKKSREKGYKYFGLQFYGECWSGDSHQYYRDGKKDGKCYGPDFKPCDDNADTECVGEAFTNYIYEVDGDVKTPENGGWTEWSEWTPCDRKCGSGQRVRERSCTNPPPSNGGKYCEGEGEEAGVCNIEPCSPVCKKKIEIGIVADASTSVTSKKYKIMKEFVVKLSEQFTVGKDGTHFGMLHYSWDPYVDFRMTDKKYWNPVELKKKIRSIEYPYGGTRTDLALYEADKAFFCSGCARKGIPKVLIVITDGKSSMESDSMTDATKSMKAKGVKIISIGIHEKKIDKSELLEIASDKNHVFIIEDFKYLVDKLNTLVKLSCVSGSSLG